MENKIEIATNIISKATLYNGKVYGGFVRDVIVPRLYNPKLDVDFKDIDLWFQDQTMSNVFEESLTKNFLIKSSLFLNVQIRQSGEFGQRKDLEYPSEGKSFNRVKFSVHFKEKLMFYIDIITCELLPVNDFNVNTLCYQFKSGFVTDNKNSTFLISEIKNKRATMLKEYEKKNLSHHYVIRINRIFFEKGWTLVCEKRHNDVSDFINKFNTKIGSYVSGIDGLDVLYYYGQYSNFYPGMLDNVDVMKPKINDKSSDKVYIAMPKTNDKSSDKDLEIIMLIFNEGLECLNKKVNVKITDEKTLEEYRVKFANMLSK